MERFKEMLAVAKKSGILAKGKNTKDALFWAAVHDAEIFVFKPRIKEAPPQDLDIEMLANKGIHAMEPLPPIFSIEVEGDKSISQSRPDDPFKTWIKCILFTNNTIFYYASLEYTDDAGQEISTENIFVSDENSSEHPSLLYLINQFMLRIPREKISSTRYQEVASVQI